LNENISKYRHDFLLFFIVLIPVLDRIFLAYKEDYVTQRLADILIIFLTLYVLLKDNRWHILDKGLFTVLTSILLLSLLFFATDLSQISARQSISLILSAMYVYLVVFISSKYSLNKFIKYSLWVFFLNCVVVIVVGIFPDIFSFLVMKMSNYGRNVLGYQLPFVRNAGLFNHYGYFAVGLLASLFMLEYARQMNRIKLPVYVLYWATCYVAVIVSQSRAALIGLIFTSTILFIYKVKISNMYKFLIVIFLLVLFFDDLLSLWNSFVNIKAATFDQRLYQINIGLSILEKSPFFGGGYSVYFQENDVHVLHNMFVNILSSVGIVGFVVFIFMNASLIFMNKSNNMKFIAAIFLSGSHLVLLASSGLSFYTFWLVVAIAISVSINHSKQIDGHMQRTHER
jgi:hypothetical protein